jgi:ferric-dicitrate binding protein FerR (iron transport regulator)
VAQHPTATITSLTKDVFVSFQGETPVSALAGTLLRQGDSIRTYSEANAMLHLSDGSKLQLKENTNLRIIAMTKEPMIASSFELLWGRVRSILSPLYQKPDSSFTIQTPNAVVNITSSELDAEVLYEPTTKTTTVLAHEFGVDVRNEVTGVSLRLPQGHSAIIYEGIIQEIAEIIDLSQTPATQQEPATLTSLEGEVFVSFQGAVSTSAIKGTVLRAGDEIYTDANASAVLEFSDGTT